MTNLTVGSAAIISYQEDDQVIWSIVLLEDIEAGTEFSFTDNGWLAGGGFRVGESEGMTFTAGQALAAGTVITFTNTTAVLAGTATSVGTMSGDPIDLSVGGSNGEDQIFMYQGSFDTTTGVVSPDFQFVTAYHANSGWDADATDNSTSALPTELTNYSVDQSMLGQKDNAVYVGPTGGTKAQIWEDIQDQSNWVGGGNPEADPYLSGFNALSDFTVVGTDPYIFTPDSPLFEANSTGNVITGISIADADSDRVSVTLTVEGTVTLAQTTDLNFITGDGIDDSTVTFSGLIEDVNAALDGLLYTPATDDIDGDTLQIIVSDGSAVIAPGTFPASIDLSALDGTDGFSIDGLAQADRLGYDVSYAGDINGDGIDDIIIGAPYADDGVLIDHDNDPLTNPIQKNYGEAYVIYGTDAGFSSSIDLTALDGTNGFVITNTSGYQGDELGHAVSNLGDINGDGINDYAVGSFNANKDNGMGGTTNDAGKTWVIFGTGSAMPATFDLSSIDGTNGFVVTGDIADDYSGRVITAGGDINGDGIDDFIIAADRTDTPGDKAGGVYVIYGTDEGFDANIDLADIETGDGSVGTYIFGAAAGDRAGRDVHSAGDINGDGIDDIIIGAYQSTFDADGDTYADHYAGKAFVVFGQDGGLGGTVSLGSLDGTNGFTMDGLAAEDITGRGVSTAGDVNGDGIDDIMIAAPLADANGSNSGAVYIVYGTTEGFDADIDLSALDGTNGFTIVGNADAWIGYDVANLGDINGDGIDDILIGSTSSLPNGTHDTGPTNSNNGNTDGAYVVFGTDEGFSATFDLGDIDGTNGFQLADVLQGDNTGFSVSTAGDINDDGIADLIIGANGADPNGSNSGRVYVVFGNANISTSYISDNLAIQLEAPPVIADMDGDTATFTEGDTQALLDTDTAVSITDAESTDFDGGVLDIQYASGQESEDGLNVDTSGTVALSAGQTAGSEVSVGGTVIGTIVSGETGASGEGLQFALNADATPALVQTLLAAIGYTNSAGDTPTAGDRTFTITLDDGDGADTEITTTVTVVAVDSAPTLTLPAAQSFAVNSTGNSITGLSVGDVDSDTVTVTLTVEGTITLAQTTGLTFDAGADGSSTMTISGTIADVNAAIATLTYTPATDDRDGDTLSMTVTDGTTPVADTVSIALTNTDPVAQDDDLSVGEDGPALADDVLADNGSGADADANNDTLTVTEVDGESADVGSQIMLASGALLTLNTDGTFTYDPNGQFEDLDETETATDSFTYTVSDGFGGTATATATVTVQGANDAPVAIVPVGQSFAVNSIGNTITGLSFSDVDDTTATVTLTAEGTITLAQTTGLSFDAGADGSSTMTISGTIADLNAAIATLTYTPATDDRDGDTISVSFDDGTDVTNGSIAITLNNTDPVAADDDLSVNEDGPALTGDLLADNGNGADADANNDTLSVTEVDGESADVGSEIVLASGALLTVNSDGTFTYDPNGQFEDLDETETATESFTYTVSDGFGGTSTATATVTIQGANDVPVIITPVGQSFAVNSTGNTVTGLSFSDGDDDSATVTLTAEGVITLAQTAGLTFDAGADGSSSMTISGTVADLNAAIATLTYSPATDDRDGDTISVSINDGTGTTNGSIAVSLTNTDPVAQDDADSVDESGSLAGDVFADNGNGVDSDANGDTLTVTEVDGESGDVDSQIVLASGALLTLNSDGTFAYDPNGAFDGLAAGETDTDSFTYTVSDGFGGTDTATVTLTINGENDGPTAQDDAASVSETGTLTGDVFADNGNGVDSDPNGDTITVIEVNGETLDVGEQIMLASGALLTLNSDGTFAYDPNGAFDGLADGETDTDSFSYTISDGLGGTDTATATITVNGENEAPVAQDDAASVDETGTLTGDVLADNGNGIDDDANGDTLTVTEVNGVGASVGSQIALASGALLTVNSDGTFSYDPNNAFDSLAAGETDTDSFSYTVDDGNGGSDTATMTITINGENDGPAASDDAFSTSEDGPNVTGDVLADNGNGVDSDPNSDTLTVTEVNGQSSDVGSQVMLASGALLTLNSDGTFTYDPNGAFDSLQVGQSDSDSFTYTISDGLGGTDTATATIDVSGANDVPIETVPGTQDFLANTVDNALTGISVADPDDTQLLITLSVEGTLSLGQTTGLTFTLGDGTDDSAMAFSGTLANINAALAGLTYTPDAGDLDGDTLSIGSFDGDATTSQTVDITLTNVAPDAVDDVVSVGDTLSVSGSVFADNGDGVDSDDNGDVLTVTAVNGSGGDVGVEIVLASGALLTLNGDGSYSYDTNGVFQGLLPGQTGSDSFTYTVEDGYGGTDSATVSVTIIGSLEGNDVIVGTSGADTLNGGNGNDTLIGGDDGDHLIGDAGDDVLSGGTGADTLEGRAGADTLYGGDGDDALFGGNDNDVLYGNAGNDTLSGNGGNDTLSGGAGDDELYGFDGDDRLYGAADNDDLYGSAGNDILDGNDGDDFLSGGTGTDTLYGGLGNDYLLGGADADTLYGGDGVDTLVGDGGDDFLSGGAGDDTLYGLADNDYLLGGAGADDLDGGDGNDTLVGDAGDDFLNGGRGDDFLYGMDDNDYILGGDGADSIYGNAGNDLLVGDAGNDFLSGSTGDDQLYGFADDDYLLGGDGNDQLYGGDGNDKLAGDAGNDTLEGGSGIDQLFGLTGNDILRGGDGEDILLGGRGDDTLTGGAGVDRFMFDGNEPGADTVTDFVAGERVTLNGFGFADEAEAASHFQQVGGNVVFTRGAVSITFTGASLSEVLDAVELDVAIDSEGASTPAAMTMSMERVELASDSFDFSGVEETGDTGQTGDAFLIDTLVAPVPINEPMIWSVDGLAVISSIDDEDQGGPDFYDDLFLVQIENWDTFSA